ncbi:MAG TPA: hypothetical protein VGG28_34230 [Kofleriaceae bacterium]|jgi:hypothetical protein
MRGVCLAVILTSATAVANEPISIAMDRGDDGVRADASLTIIPASAFALRADAYVQYVDPRFHAGGYVAMPFTFEHPDYGYPSSSWFGNLELGALYVAHVLPQLRVVARVGIVLPTYNDPTSISGDVLRLTDWVDNDSDATTLRFAVSPIYRNGVVFTRVDIGFDRGPTPERLPEATSFVRVNAAVGVAVERVAFSVESVNLYATNGPFIGNGTLPARGASWRDEVVLGGQYQIGVATPYFAFVLPADHDMRQSFDAALTIGCDVRLR